MQKTSKQSCFLERRCVGHWGLDPIIKWIAIDYWGHEVARADTKSECRKEARTAGYTPRD